MAERTMIEAIRLALHEAMTDDDTVVLLGEDVGVDGGVFRATEGLHEEFGPWRVFDSPLAEAVIVGASVGMAIAGARPVCELQFSGFSYLGFHQLEEHAARMRWRSRGRFGVPMVVRMPYGAGVRALEHHSESKEVIFAHVPGLTTVIPSGPRSARALLAAAIRSPDPVVFLEPKSIYRAFREEVPDEPEVADLRSARRVREGDDITLVAWGAMVRRTQEAADALADDGIECDVIDLQTISPLDESLIVESAQQTGRVAIVHEAHRSFGPAGEIIARLVEQAFWQLEAPIARVTGYDVHVPYFAREQAYLPDGDRIADAIRRTVEEPS